MQEREKEHSVVIERKKQITVNGVESVTAFSEVKITLALLGGERMYIVGTDLKIIGFSKTNGTFSAEGSVSGISYGGKSFAARLFR